MTAVAMEVDANAREVDAVVQVSATWKIYGIPHYYNQGNVSGILDKLGLEFVDVFTRKNNNNAFVRFKSVEEKLRAKDLLEAYTERKIERLRCIEHPDRIKQQKNEHEREQRMKAKRKRQQEKDQNGKSKDSRKSKPEPQTIHDIVTPLYQMPYGDQIALKERKITGHLRHFWRKLIKPQDPKNALFLKWLHNDCPSPVFGVKNLPIGCPPFQGVVASPITSAYRNNASFSIGYNKSTNLLTVGHQMGRFENGAISIEPVAECIPLDAVCKRIALCGQSFVRQQFNAHHYDCYDKKTHLGIWRKLDIRISSRCKQYVLFLEIQSQTLSAEQLEKLKNDFVECMRIEGEVIHQQFEYKLNGVSMMLNNSVSTANSNECPLEVLYGDPFHFDIICGLKFRISSTAFFQVNTIAAERLYEIAAQWASDGHHSKKTNNRIGHRREKKIVLLDICCGTGTIGLCVAKECGDTIRQLIGLELIEDAVNDAKRNAELNGFGNTRFEAGRAEETLQRVLDEEVKEGDDVVAILDPPRCGVHRDICKLLRMQSRISRIVYVSCNAATLFQDAVRLCQAPSKKQVGVPFKPVKSIGVDLFPHAEHVEMIMLFERCRDGELDWSQISLQAKEAHRKYLYDEEQKRELIKKIDLICCDIMEFMFCWRDIKEMKSKSREIKATIRRLFVVHEISPHAHKFIIDVVLPVRR